MKKEGHTLKSVLIVGMGRFGRHAAQQMRDLHHEVLAIDHSEQRINDVLSYVTNAQIGDSTNEAFIASLGVRNFDLCMVAIGDDFQSSLETTALLKEHGARFVLARATRDVHAKFLLRNGADEIIYPEKQMARWASVRYTSDNIFDYVQLTKDYSIYETAVPASWVGKSIAQMEIRQRYHINILATKRSGELDPLPGPNHCFSSDETLLILGYNKDMQKFLNM